MKICGLAIPAYLTNQPNAGNRVLFEKLTVVQIVMKFHIFYGS